MTTKQIKIGPYTVVKELSSGGQAQVLLARRDFDDGTRKACVLKLPLAASMADERKIRQFFSELRISMLLEHNNIVPVFDSGTHEGVPYYAAGYVAGRDLSEFAEELRVRQMQWGFDIAAHVIREVGHALTYAHHYVDHEGRKLQIVHRDVKPHNIMVSTHGSVLLMDFGVASSLSVHSTHNHIKGTLKFMAPEHIAGRATAKSDAFSLGAVLWELLAGRPFREGFDRDTMGVKALEGEVPPMPRQGIPPSLEQVLWGLLEKDHDRRMTVDEAVLILERDFGSARLRLKELFQRTFESEIFYSGHEEHLLESPEKLKRTFAVAKAGGALDEFFRHQKHQRTQTPLPAPSTDDIAAAELVGAALEPSKTVPEQPEQQASSEAKGGTVLLPQGGRVDVVKPPSSPTEQIPPSETTAEPQPVPEGTANHTDLEAASSREPSATDLTPRGSQTNPSDMLALSPDTRSELTAFSTPRKKRRVVLGVVGALGAVVAGISTAAAIAGGSDEPSPTATSPRAPSAAPLAVAPTPPQDDDTPSVATPPPEESLDDDPLAQAIRKAAPKEEPPPAPGKPDVDDVAPTETNSEQSADHPSPAEEANDLSEDEEKRSKKRTASRPGASKQEPKQPKPTGTVKIVRGFIDYGEVRLGRKKYPLAGRAASHEFAMPVGIHKIYWRHSDQGEWEGPVRMRVQEGYRHTILLGDMVKVTDTKMEASP